MKNRSRSTRSTLSTQFLSIIFFGVILFTPIVLSQSLTHSGGTMHLTSMPAEMEDGFIPVYKETGILKPRISHTAHIQYSEPLTAGTYYIGAGQYFETIDDAFDYLHINGISGPITLMLSDPTYQASASRDECFFLEGPIPGASATNRITLRPAEHQSVVLTGRGSGVLFLQDVSFFTLDGIALTGDTQLRIHAFFNKESKNNEAVVANGNCDFVIFQRATLSTDDVNRLSAALSLYSDSSSSPDNCLITDLNLTSGFFGITITGRALTRPANNIIRGNRIGVPADNRICFGIHDQLANGTIIENNHMENFRSVAPVTPYTIGINIFAGTSTVVRNNIVHNLFNNREQPTVIGILASGGNVGSDTYRGIHVQIYNNKVWDLAIGNSTFAGVRGITAWYNDSVKIDYNTVYLVEAGDAIPYYGSSAARIQASCLYPFIRNNILVNTRDDDPYSSIAIEVLNNAGESNYNDLFVGTSSTAYVGKTITTFKTLNNWQGLGRDKNSASVLPEFVYAHIHINTGNRENNHFLDRHGIPIQGIDSDIEGHSRNATFPSIGADEFEIATGIPMENTGIPFVYQLEQNYPNPFNPTTVIRYQLPVAGNVQLSLTDVLGREIAILVNEEQSAGVKEVRWDGAEKPSGIYFYRLQCGGFVETKRMMLIK